MNIACHVKFVSVIVIVFASTLSLGQENSDSSKRYVPSEFQASDPEVKTLLDSAMESASEGKYSERTQSLQKALTRCADKGLLADKAIVEDRLAATYFSEGKIEDARKQWANALSDGVSSSNLVLQADVLTALATFSQMAGNVMEALDLANRALDLARKSKSLYVESRVLGELARLQLIAGKTAEARASVESALRIDRLNKYDWEPSHLLYLGWITIAESESNFDRMMEIEKAARELAIQKDDYIVFVQATTFIGQAYVHKGQLSAGIDIFEHAQDGTSDRGEPLFRRPDSYRAAVSLPFLRVAFLEALAMAYQAGQRPDQALKIWQQLYDTGKGAGFTLAAAEAAHAMADVYSTKKDYDKSISCYSLAAQTWAAAGNERRRIDALTSEESLLFRQGQKDKALQVEEELLPLAKASKNIRLQFIGDVVITELLDGTGKLDRVESALKDAESLVGADVNVPGVEPSIMVEFYSRLADLYEKRKNVQQELIALEKAITPAMALSSAPADTKNGKPLAWLVPQLEATIAQNHVRDAAEKTYAAGDFADALVYSELLRYFEEIDAAWNSKYEEYTKNLNNDATTTRLLQIPFKLISQDDGATALAKNIEDMGPIAERVRRDSLFLLTTYYTLHRRPEMVVKFAKQVLPSLSETPNEWDVSMSCQLAYALMLEKDLKSAVETIGHCMEGAKKRGIPELLQVAHQTNVWVLEAAGKHDEAQESIQFLLKQKPDDPLQYAQLAQVRAEQGDGLAAADAWKKAIQLYEARHNLSSAADAHLALANLLTHGSIANPEEQRVHLEAANELYRQLRSSEGQVKSEASLGAYYAAQNNTERAHQYFEGALKIARETKRKNLEADVLFQVGQAYESSDDLTGAIENYRKSDDIYEQLNDFASAAFQLKNVATALNASYKPEEALETILRAKAVADKSDSWGARYWVRRFLAEIYESQGQYQNSLTVLQEAKHISDNANQPLASAWAALGLAGALEAIGGWQEASEQVNSVIPVLQQFKDMDDESLAYMELMAIYGARESEIKDLDKALEFYQMAYQLVGKTNPGRAASLNLNITETYWDQGRFKEAIVKATEALDYYKLVKNEPGEAGALISLAEAQRSDGDLQAAAHSLQLAEPLVIRVKDFYTTGRFYYQQAGLLRKQGRFKEAIDQYERVIQLLEQFKSSSSTGNRQLVSETYSFIYDELIETYYSLGAGDKQYAQLSAEKALEYTELNKSKVFANSWGQVFIDGLKRRVPAPLQERERVLLARQGSLQSELQSSMAGTAHKSVKQVEDTLDSLKKEQTEFVQQLRTTSPAYAAARYPQPIALAQIPVHSDELLIEFKMLQDSVLVWMVEGSAAGGHLVAFYKVDRPRNWFEKHVVSLRDVFNSGRPEQFDPKICEELFNSLFPEPFAERLKTAQSVIFIPDDVLFLLPFEMLSPNASQGQFVLLRTATEYFPSAAVFKLSRAAIRARQPWQEQFIGIADPITSPADGRYVAATILSESKPTKAELAQNDTPVFRGLSVERTRSWASKLERLPDTAAEVKGIANLFPGAALTTEVRTGVNATKQELMQTDLGRFRFVHFATHGILPVEADIKEPALVLSYDGANKDDMLLTLSEVFQLKLHADMVVLSACNTGSGKVTRAEGVASLGTAFLAAGASSATVSLWHVADNSTAILMQDFYRNLLKGMPKAASLAAARSALFARGEGFENPFYWAPFVLTGE